MDERSARKILKRQYQRQNNYVKANYDRVSVTLPKGTKEKIIKAGYTVNGLINELVREKLAEISEAQE